MKKRGLSIFGFFLTSVLFRIVLVSAYGVYDFLRLREGSQTLINLIVDWAEPFLAAILGGDYYTGEILFTKFLFFILFFAFIWLALSRVDIFREQKPVKLIICLIVPILSLRYIDVAWILTILTTYQILGIAITSIIPFIIYFFFINGVFPDNSLMRKFGWILFIIVYFGLYVTSNADTYSEVYFWTGIVGLVFLLADGTIQRIWLREQYKKSASDNLRREIAKLQEDIDLFEDKQPPGYKKTVERLRRRQKELSKYL